MPKPTLRRERCAAAGRPRRRQGRFEASVERDPSYQEGWHRQLVRALRLEEAVYAIERAISEVRATRGSSRISDRPST